MTLFWFIFFIKNSCIIFSVQAPGPQGGNDFNSILHCFIHLLCSIASQNQEVKTCLIELLNISFISDMFLSKCKFYIIYELVNLTFANVVSSGKLTCDYQAFDNRRICPLTIRLIWSFTECLWIFQTKGETAQKKLKNIEQLSKKMFITMNGALSSRG